MPNARGIVNAAPPDDGGSDRRWLAESAGAETYLGAFARMLVRPTTFALAWTRGAKTISPLKLTTLSVALVAALTQLAEQGQTTTTLLDLVNSVTPIVMFALLGVLIHTAYKVFGSRRSVETSLGLTLFTIAGPGVLFPLAMLALFVFVKLQTRSSMPAWQYVHHQSMTVQLATTVALFVFYLWPRIVLGRVMHVAHRRRWWWTVLAIVFAEVVVALLFGALQDLVPSSGAVFNWPRLIIGPTLDRFGLYW